MATKIFFSKVGYCYQSLDILSISENKNKMDLDLSKIGRYVNLGLFKTKGAKCNSIKIC